jgi:hypothetical protein
MIQLRLVFIESDVSPSILREGLFPQISELSQARANDVAGRELILAVLAFHVQVGSGPSRSENSSKLLEVNFSKEPSLIVGEHWH